MQPEPDLHSHGHGELLSSSRCVACWGNGQEWPEGGGLEQQPEGGQESGTLTWSQVIIWVISGKELIDSLRKLSILYFVGGAPLRKPSILYFGEGSGKEIIGSLLQGGFGRGVIDSLLLGLF